MTVEEAQRIYQENLPSLLTHEGEFVIIHHGRVDGFWSSYEEALRAGYERFGLDPFFVKKVERDEPAQFFTRDVPERPG